jgi:CRISPR-associated endonuclease Csn1
MPTPWPTYRDHVKRAVNNIWVSHKPDHGYQGEMFDQTIYSPTGFSRSAAKIRSVLPFASHKKDKAQLRHGIDANGGAKPYRGLLSNSNYCIEIVREEAGCWAGEVIPTYRAYAEVAKYKEPKEGFVRLRNPSLSLSGKSLVMRLSIGDNIRVEIENKTHTLQVLKINSSGSITFIKPNESNIPARYLAKLKAQKAKQAGEVFDTNALGDSFFQQAFSAESLRSAQARRVTISPIGELRDPGFKG